MTGTPDLVYTLNPVSYTHLDVYKRQAFEMWVWRAMGKVRCVDNVRNDEVLRRIGEERNNQ